MGLLLNISLRSKLLRPKEEDNWHYFEYLLDCMAIMRGVPEGDAEYSQFVVNEIIRFRNCFIKLLLFHLYKHAEIPFCVISAIDIQCS